MERIVKRAVFVLKKLFIKSKHKLINRFGNVDKDYIIKVKLEYDNVCSIKTSNEEKGFVKFITVNEEVYYLKKTLLEILKSTSTFIRISKSVLVNVNNIKSLNNNIIYLENGEKLTVSKVYLKSFKKKLESLFTI